MRNLNRHLGVDISPAQALTVVGPAAVLVFLGWRSGGYYPDQWGMLILAFALLAIVGVIVRPRIHLGRLDIAFLTLLIGIACWQLLSVLWSTGAGPPVREVERTLVYVAAAVALVVLVDRSRAGLLVVAVTVGVTVVSLGGLIEHLFPGGLRGYRLGGPMGYANAAGLLAALGLVLCLGFALRGPRWQWLAASAATVPLAATLYLSFSRGAIVAVLIGIGALIALEPGRLRAFATIALLSVPIGLTVYLVGREPALSGPVGLEAMQSVGRRVALELLPVIGLAAAAGEVAHRVGGGATLSARARKAVGAVLAVLVVAVIAAVLVREGGPVALVERSIDAFRAAPPEGGPQDLNRRLLNASGNERAAYWRVAADMVGREPLLGEGAGSYERWWTQERPRESGARNAHNLYLEMLAELGPAGLLLVLGVIGLPILAVRRAKEMPLAPAAAAGLVVYGSHAALDWDWQVPIETLPAVGLAAAVLVAARPRMRGTALTAGRRALAVAGLAPLVAVALVTHVGNGSAAASERAFLHADAPRALLEAQRAQRWMPWSALPFELRGESETVLGRLAEAERSLRRAIERDPASWRAWYDLAVALSGDERATALERASRLNPLSTEIAALRTGS